MSELEWNYDEFVCFLLIYVSHIDMEFSDEEKSRIQNSYAKATFDKMYQLFDGMSDYASLESILKYKGVYFPTEDRKRELLNKVKMQFYSDGEYSILEKSLFEFLHKMM